MTVNRIDIAEFRRLGYLQEANRLFFHPLGLALEVERDDETGEEQLGGVWDYRDDPEGMLFADGMIDSEKVNHVTKEWIRLATSRLRLLGYVIQPPEDG